MNTVVVISSDKMGNGDDNLGKILIGAFIYALSESNDTPSKILFYNSGVKLCCPGRESLEDLKKLESKGCELLCCGTCMDYFKLKDDLEVGSISNMYSIVEAQNEADKIIRP